MQNVGKVRIVISGCIKTHVCVNTINKARQYCAKTIPDAGNIVMEEGLTVWQILVRSKCSVRTGHQACLCPPAGG